VKIEIERELHGAQIWLREVRSQFLFSLSISIFIHVLCKNLKFKAKIEIERELHGAQILVY
jgi:hypothetical protein